MSFNTQLLRLTGLPIAMGIFLLAAQVSGGLIVRDDVGSVHFALK